MKINGIFRQGLESERRREVSGELDEETVSAIHEQGRRRAGQERAEQDVNVLRVEVL